MNSCRELSPSVLSALLKRERIIFTARFLSGEVHNLSSAIQMISLPLDLAQLAVEQGNGHDMGPRLDSLRQGLDRLKMEVGLLAKRGLADQRGEAEPLSLARLAVEQLYFWRGDLFCKHEVTQKRRLNQVGGYVKVPYVDAALALNSLLANAVDALRGSRGGWLEVRDFEEDGRRGLAVSDNGAGPSPEMAAGLFEPFVGDKGEGHDGLGLYLAAKALEPWGGRLAWRAGAPHTTFVMDLPSA